MIVILIILGLGAGFMILAATGKKTGVGIGEIIPVKGKTGGFGGYTGKELGGVPGISPIGGFTASPGTKTSLGNKMGFIRYMKSWCEGYEWDKFLPFAMAALETNWANSCYFHNLFNITTQSNDPNQFFRYTTVPTLKFKIYVGFEESVKHFWNLLQFPRYSEAWKNRNNPEQAIVELIKGGYAGTDPITGLPVTPARYLRVLEEIRSFYAMYF